MDKKSLWIGIGIGATAGLAGGFILGNQITKRAVRKDIPRIQHDAYIKGKKDARQEQQEEYIVVESSDIGEIQKAIDNHFKNDQKEEKTEEKDEEEAPQISDSKPLKEKEASNVEDRPAETRSERISSKYNYRMHGDYIIFIGAAGTELYYPKTILFDPATGIPYDDMHIRKNFREYETDAKKLNIVWNAMGWGLFNEAPTDTYDVDIDDWDVSIGDESQLGDEPEEKTEERRKYLEKVAAYKNDPNYKPKIVTKKDFDEENYLKQVQVDYYELDNVFADSQDLDKDFDAVTMLGTNDGAELFNKKIYTEDDSDPDIIYVENFHMNSIMEVTRYHKAFSGLQDGTAFV